MFFKLNLVRICFIVALLKGPLFNTNVLIELKSKSLKYFLYSSHFLIFVFFPFSSLIKQLNELKLRDNSFHV